MGPEVWVDGRPLTSIAYWGDLEVSHRWPLGSWEAKWSMPLSPWERPPQLRTNADVRVRVGPFTIWAGNLAEPDWSEGSFAAVGACRQGETTICFDGTGETTSIPNTAIDQAITRGAVNWTRPASISAAALSGSAVTDAQNYLAALLDAYASSVSQNWYVDPQRAVRVAANPTTPTAMMAPDNGVLGTAIEAQVGTVFGRYVDSTTYTNKTVSYGAGQPERGVDFTGRGPMSAAAAIALCQGVWTPLQAQPGWTNGLTAQTGELLSIGGLPIPLWSFTAGQMIRLLGVRDLRGLSANTDVVIGESVWTPGDDTLKLNPVGKVARDIGAIVEDSRGVLL